MRFVRGWRTGLLLGSFGLGLAGPAPADDPAPTERQLGHACLDKGDFEGAIGHLDLALAANPGDVAALVDRAEAWSGKGDEAKAFADLDRALVLDPKNVAARLARGERRVEKVPDQALVDLSEAVRLDPKNGMALAARGGCNFYLEKFDLAAQDLDMAARLGCDEPEVWQLLGMIRLAQGDGPRAVAQFDKLVRVTPHDPGVRDLRTMARLMAKDYAGVVADADEATKLLPLRMMGQLMGVEPVGVGSGPAAQPESANFQWSLFRAIALRQLGRTAEASQAFEALVNQQPDNPEVRSLHAMILTDAGQFDRALAEINRAIERQPDQVGLYLNRAAIELRSHSYARTAEEYTRVVAWAPADLPVAQKADGLAGQAWIWATCPDAQFRDGARALEAANLACTLTDRKVARPLRSLAAAQAEVGDFTAALRTLDEVDRLPGAGQRAVAVKIRGAKLEVAFILPERDGDEPDPFSARARASFARREAYRDPN